MAAKSAETGEASGILAIWNDCAPGRDGDFEHWFQSEHLEERLAVPGFLFGRRHEAIAGAPRYFVFYVVRAPQTLASPAYLARLDDPTPLTRTVMSEVFRNMSRTVCRRAKTAGRFRGAHCLTLRFEGAAPEAELAALVDELAGDALAARTELWIAAHPALPGMSEEERLRGGDRRIAACLAIDTLRQADAETLAERLGARFPQAQTGVYRALCQIGNGDV